MAFQLGPGTITAYRVETAPGVLPTNDATARVFRTNSGPGLALTKKPIPSNEIRATLDMVRPRHGVRAVAGTLMGDMSLTTFDPLIEAAFRGTFAAILTSATFTLTSYVSATGIITRATGSFIGEGFKVGDVVFFNSAVGANVSIPMVLIAVGTATATVGNAKSIQDVSGPTGVTITRPKKVIQSTAPTLRTFSVEHWAATALNSERFLGCRVSSLGFNQPAEGMVGVDVGFMGVDRAIAAAQFFTAASTYTTVPMATPDAIVCYAGGQALAVQSCNLAIALQTTAPSVVGSVTVPTVFDGVMNVTGSLQIMQQDQTNIAAFQNETPLSLTLLYREQGTFNFNAVSVPTFTLGDATAQNRISPSGPVLETCPLLVGVGSGTDRDPSMITFCTTSP